MKIKYYILCFILIFTKQIFCEEKTIANDHQNEYFTGSVLINGLRIRSDKTSDSRVIGYFSKNERIKIVGRSENKEKIEETEDYWYKVKYSDHETGWVFGGFIIREENIEEREGHVNAFTVNVREFFGPGNKIIEQISQNEKFKIVSKTDKKMQVDDDEDYWYKVQLTNGKKGWIFGSLLVAEEKTEEKKEVTREETTGIIH